jgi:hypothetical protein
MAGEDPSVDTAFRIYFHTIRHTIRFVRGHICKDAPAPHVTLLIKVEDVDIGGPAGIGHVEAALVGRER